jgi:hypothetical protein
MRVEGEQGSAEGEAIPSKLRENPSKLMEIPSEPREIPSELRRAVRAQQVEVARVLTRQHSRGGAGKPLSHVIGHLHVFGNFIFNAEKFLLTWKKNR